jgi:hypothetical protein
MRSRFKACAQTIWEAIEVAARSDKLLFQLDIFAFAAFAVSLNFKRREPEGRQPGFLGRHPSRAASRPPRDDGDTMLL